MPAVRKFKSFETWFEVLVGMLRLLGGSEVSNE